MTGWVYRLDPSGAVWIMTNEHAVEGIAEALVIPHLGDDQFLGQVMGSDRYSDLAVIRICCDANLRALEIGDIDEMRLRDEVVAFGYRSRARASSELNWSPGVVASIGNDEIWGNHMVQVYAAMNRVNTGGPIVDRFGRVVASVSDQIVTIFDNRISNATGFAVSSRTINDQLPALELDSRSRTQTSPNSTQTEAEITLPPTISDHFYPVIVAIGESDQRGLDEQTRNIIANAMRIEDDQLPAVERGYRLTIDDLSDDGEIVLRTSGDWAFSFSEIPSSFDFYKTFDPTIDAKLFGRVCTLGERCDAAKIIDLQQFLMRGEIWGGGRGDLAPFMTFDVKVPSASQLEVELIAYYTSRSTTSIPADASPFGPRLAIRGKVTVDDRPPTNLDSSITARIGDIWESFPVKTSDFNDGLFLVIAPPGYLSYNLLGSKIEFWLDGREVSPDFSYYGQINEFTGEILPRLAPWVTLRDITINFSSFP